MPMAVRDFLSLVLERVTELLPEERRGFTARIRFVWLQIHYHTPKVHYEVWLVRKSGRIEIGLHFEGPREFSYRWAAALAPYLPEIQGRLGPQVEMEEWTPSWTRIHQTIPYEALHEALAQEVARRLADTIAVLQPLVEQVRPRIPEELEGSAPARPLGSRRFGGRRPRRHSQ